MHRSDVSRTACNAVPVSSHKFTALLTCRFCYVCSIPLSGGWIMRWGCCWNCAPKRTPLQNRSQRRLKQRGQLAARERRRRRRGAMIRSAARRRRSRTRPQDTLTSPQCPRAALRSLTRCVSSTPYSKLYQLGLAQFLKLFSEIYLVCTAPTLAPTLAQDNWTDACKQAKQCSPCACNCHMLCTAQELAYGLGPSIDVHDFANQKFKFLTYSFTSALDK